MTGMYGMFKYKEAISDAERAVRKKYRRTTAFIVLGAFAVITLLFYVL